MERITRGALQSTCASIVARPRGARARRRLCSRSTARLKARRKTRLPMPLTRRSSRRPLRSLTLKQQLLQMQQRSTCVWHDVAMQAWWRRSWRLGRPNGSCRCRGCPGFCPWRRPWPALCWTCSACVAPELHVDVRRAPNAAVAPSGRRGPAAAAAKAVRTCSGRPSDREAGRRHLWVPRAL